MSLEADVFKLLTTQFLGESAPGFGTRAYPVIAPENVTYPCAIYDQDTAQFERDLGGDGLFDHHFYTVAIASQQMQEAEVETELIKTNLHGFSGSSINASQVTLDNDIRGIFVNASTSYYDIDTKSYFRELELQIHVKRTS